MQQYDFKQAVAGERKKLEALGTLGKDAVGK